MYISLGVWAPLRNAKRRRYICTSAAQMIIHKYGTESMATLLDPPLRRARDMLRMCRTIYACRRPRVILLIGALPADVGKLLSFRVSFVRVHAYVHSRL